ncbi:phage holin family protein [Candidatus Cardinium hertigii]|uniref:phage holin family protein n=1 Tax=Candidatus Cardinium hertigii TaxID=247481 RepID=UPI001FAB0FE8|nr:hypothetical protein [Candidatus Cardinium hertigii]
MNNILFRIIKIVGKLLGIACMVEIVREKLTIFLYSLQHNLKAQVKKIIRLFFMGTLAFILFSLGLRFLLHGLACWLNAIFASAYLGFFIVSIFCFLMVTLIIFRLRNKINNQEKEQEEFKNLQ